MYKTFPGTTYPSCIFHESELDLKHINIKIPRSIFFFKKKGHVSKNTKRPISARPPHVTPNPHPACSAPVRLLMPVFRWPLLTSRSLPVILFTFLSFLLSLHFLPSLPSLPLDPFILPCNHLDGTQIIFVRSCLSASPRVSSCSSYSRPKGLKVNRSSREPGWALLAGV